MIFWRERLSLSVASSASVCRFRHIRVLGLARFGFGVRSNRSNSYSPIRNRTQAQRTRQPLGSEVSALSPAVGSTPSASVLTPTVAPQTATVTVPSQGSSNTGTIGNIVVAWAGKRRGMGVESRTDARTANNDPSHAAVGSAVGAATVAGPATVCTPGTAAMSRAVGGA